MVAVSIFTAIISIILIRWGIYIGIISIFVLLLSIIVYLLLNMIAQMFDLLSNPPLPGKTINPFQIIILGKILWQFPNSGAFIFMEHQAVNNANSLEKVETGDNYEIPVNLVRRSKLGPKPRFTEEEYLSFVEKWFKESLETGIKQDDFCRKHNLGATRNFSNYIKLYKERPNRIVRN
jgi:hypothetical protein